MTISRLVNDVQADNRSSPLDLFSISQTSELANVTYAPPEQALRCINNAPFFAWKSTENGYSVAQGCCNDWKCPRCGVMRAKHEYGRIVEGCRTLAVEHPLYFITITCRGREMSLEQSEAGYLTWTNKLLTACRTRASRNDDAWYYVQVTERQKRGHPHSHILTTWKPHGLYLGTKDDWQTVNGQRVNIKKPALRSDWFEQRCISAGLGNQYDISLVESVEGASRYVAKYMFKETMFSTDWPKNWRRVRYSQSFPQLPTQETDAFVLMKHDDWKKLAGLALVVNPRDEASLKACKEYLQLHGHDVLIKSLGDKKNADIE